MSDDLVRRKVFWLLQRLTSYSLWQKKAEAWRVFAQAYENAVKTWPEDDPQRMNADNLVRIYETLSAYEQGLAELKDGHRSVWRTAQPFRRVIDNYTVLTKFFFTHPAYWERGMQEAPYPPKVEALNRLMRASEYVGDHLACEVPFRDDTWANVTSPGMLLNHDAYRFEFHELPYPVFPAMLPELPVAPGLVVPSGQPVPVDGIWEPVRNTPARVPGLPLGGKKTESAGCFNYLVKGTVAPNMLDSGQDMTNGVKTVGVDWRLLWEDRRYRDGVVRAESDYFLRSAVDENETAPVSEALVELTTSSICPVSGMWVAIGYDVPPVTILEGTVMPDLVTDNGQGERRSHWVTWRLHKRL